MKNYGPVVASVTEFVVFLLVFIFAGHWLDKRTGGPAKFIFAGVFIGFGFGMFRLVKNLKSIMDSDDDNQGGPPSQNNGHKGSNGHAQ